MIPQSLSPAADYQTFHPFRRFPPELRDMIWVAALEPRLVELDTEDAMGIVDLGLTIASGRFIIPPPLFQSLFE